MNRLRNLDAYPKINEDFYKRTLSGRVITLFSSVVMLILFFSELRKCISLFKARCFVVYSFFFLNLCGLLGLYMHPVTETQLRVDTSRGEKLRINVKALLPLLLVL